MGFISGCKVCSSAPPITHLLFADDSFLFFKATTEQTTAIQNILNSYARFSGQAVNFQKSAIFFSANVHMDKQEEIKQFLGVRNEVQDSRYLGLPSLIGRLKKTVFRYLKDKIFQRIQNLSSKLLSRAGKAVMIKNVLQTIPAYTMSCFKVPKTLCQEIERLMNAFWWKSNGSNNKGIRWCAWDKISMSKRRGGLGFRNLQGFNMALLGKQCWNLITKPDSLVARVLKARYYPRCHLIHATRSGGSSYTWSGLWEAKESMQNGLRWVLGDGQSISIKSDRWLRGSQDFRVNQVQTSASSTAKVCEFFQTNTKMWDEEKVKQYFTETDARAILNTRIPNMCIKDRIAWSHSSNGQYTVKSEQHQWHKSNVQETGVQEERGWNRIWSLEVPHKLRIFLWRFCRNNIHVRKLLRSRGIIIPMSCPMCTRDIEHLIHLFFECQFAKECWQIIGLSYNMWDVEYGDVWLLDRFNSASDEVLIKITVVLWGIWFARNKRIFESTNITPAVAMNWSKKQVDEWRQANKKPQVSSTLLSTSSREDIKWHPPVHGALKVNVDAALTEGRDFFAVGMVLRNNQGQFLAGRVMRFAGQVPVVEA